MFAIWQPIAVPSQSSQQSGSADIGISLNLSATGVKLGSATLQISFSLSGASTKSGTASIPISVSLSATGVKSGSANLPVSVTLTGSGKKFGSANLPVSITLSGSGKKFGSANLSVAITLSGSGKKFGSANLPVSITFSGSGKKFGSANLSVSITLSGSGKKLASANISASLTLTGSGKKLASATLPISITLSASSLQPVFATIPISLTLSATGLKKGAATLPISVILTNGNIKKFGNASIPITLSFSGFGFEINKYDDFINDVACNDKVDSSNQIVIPSGFNITEINNPVLQPPSLEPPPNWSIPTVQIPNYLQQLQDSDQIQDRDARQTAWRLDLDGGSAGQVLRKRSDRNFDWEWGSAGGGGLGNLSWLIFGYLPVGRTIPSMPMRYLPPMTGRQWRLVKAVGVLGEKSNASGYVECVIATSLSPSIVSIASMTFTGIGSNIVIMQNLNIVAPSFTLFAVLLSSTNDSSALNLELTLWYETV